MGANNVMRGISQLSTPSPPVPVPSYSSLPLISSCSPPLLFSPLLCVDQDAKTKQVVVTVSCFPGLDSMATPVAELGEGRLSAKAAQGSASCCLPAPSGANEKSSPRGAPMQHLAPRRNPEG